VSRLKLTATILALAAAAPALAEVTHTQVTDCIYEKTYERATAKDCPSLMQIRREILRTLCRPLIDAYVSQQSAEMRGPITEAVNEYTTNAVESYAPELLKRSLCD
jgi:hypothetical protein